MNKIKIESETGFPVQEESIDYMQGAYSQATAWQNVVYLNGFENGGTGNMQYRIDESGKGLVVGMFVTKPVALERNIYVIAQTGLRPQRRQPAMISCFNRFTESVTSNNAPIERDTVIVFGHIEIDGKLTVERYVEGLTFNVYKKGFVSACIDLD